MTKPNDDISLERLREVLSYDPATGLFVWLLTLAPRGKVGTIAGSLKPSGYVCVDIDGTRHRAHRLAWLYMTGEHAPGLVDHRDNVRNHNWWTNLRLANNQQNGANSKRKHYGTSGYKGVFWCKQKQKWKAKISISGRQIHLGTHDTKERAARAYATAAKMYFGEFARNDAPHSLVDLEAVRREIEAGRAMANLARLAPLALVRA